MYDSEYTIYRVEGGWMDRGHYIIKIYINKKLKVPLLVAISVLHPIFTFLTFVIPLGLFR